mmetsp:Transcript_36163/g.47697  ORF Transcript_36163/g.47697 Transcript_36163/m.47697 type:complete len:247 (+) Transcript_36163:87-827(+)
MQMKFTTFVVVLCTFNLSKAFLNPNFNTQTSSTWRENSLKMVPSDLISSSLLSFEKVSQEQAQANFYFFFFAGSGALGIGFAQVPKLIAEYKEVQSRGGGESMGGKDLQCSPFATIGYPEPLKELDVQYVIDNMPSTDKIAAAGEKKAYLSQMGFLERKAFYKCLPNANPLVLYAAFDAMAKGGGSFVSPDQALEVVQQWKEEGPQAFARSLQAATLKKYSAYIVFAFLIGLVLDLIVDSGVQAFL